MQVWAASPCLRWVCRRNRQLESWWRCTDSNRGPPACKAGALPTELHPLIGLVSAGSRPSRCLRDVLPTARHLRNGLVGAPGLEPGTSALSGLRSNQLSYAPPFAGPVPLNSVRTTGICRVWQGLSQRTGGGSTSKWTRVASGRLRRKEVIQPHLPIRLPCYDLAPIADPTFAASVPYGFSQRLRVKPTLIA